MSAAGLLEPLLGAAVAAAVAALSAPVLSRLAPRLGLVDAPAGPAAARKLQLRPVPAVGGAAVLLGLCAGAACSPRAGLHGGLWPAGLGGAAAAWLPWLPSPGAALVALALAFLAGLVDDMLPGGLSPARKLGGQALAGLAAGAPALAQGSAPLALAGALGACAAAIVAINAVNTFDNSDGGAALLGAAALAGPLPIAAGALLGFLPYNVDSAGAERTGRRGGPTCYLGDSGSHLLGMLVALTPVAWPALALPLFDLARLSIARARAGSRPWVGDRRHLAHRLEAAGLSRPAVLGALAAVALPSIVAGGWGAMAGDAGLAAAGVVATGALFAFAVRLTPESN